MAEYLARQVLAEFADCNPARISDAPAFEKILRDAFGAEEILSCFLQIDPDGLRATLTSATRQVSAFTRLARRFAAVDVLFLRDEKDRSRIFTKLRGAFSAKSFLTMDVRRGNAAQRPGGEENISL